MKIGIVTFHTAVNYGAFSQTYALQKTLENLGHEVEIIDYRPKAITDFYRPLKKPMKYRPGNGLIRYLKQLLFFYYDNIPLYSQRKKKNIYFKKTSKILLHFSEKHFFSIESLSTENFNYDYYITGSDQIWNPEHTYNHLDSAYFLAFVGEKRKCISYAASIGKESLGDEHIPSFSNLIKNISVISVRESKSIPFLLKCGVDNVTNVIDPTLLLTPNDWNEIEVPYDNPNKFILIYTHTMNNNILEIAEKLSTKLNLSKIFIGDGTLKKRIKPSYVSPEEFYGLFSHASFIITDSYHGTIFGIINKKPFYTIQKEEWAFRTFDILDKLGLTSRLLMSGCSFPDDIPEINYEEVEKKLQKNRDYAISFLNSALK